MPDNVEKIVYQVENQQAIDAVKKETAALKEMDKAAGQAAETTSKAFEGTIRVVDRTANAIERATANWERQMRSAGLTQIQRIQMGQELQLRKVKGDPEAEQRIRSATDAEVRRLRVLEEYTTGLKRAQDASRQAQAGINAFADAQKRVERQTLANAEALRKENAEAAKLAETTRNIVERAQYRTAGATGRLEIERRQALRVVDPADAGAITEINRHFDTLITRQTESDRIARRNELAANLRASSDAASYFATRMAAVSTVILGGAISLIQIQASLERTRISFQTLLGSKTAGEAFFQGLIDYSRRSVFSLDELAQSAQQALALGFKPQEAMRVLQASNAAAAAMGKGVELSNRITLALGQMVAKQRVSAEEMRQLSEAGVGGWEMLAKAAGITVPEAMKKAEKGMFDARTAVQVLTDGILKNWGALEQKMREQTLQGQIAGIRNEITQLALELENELLPIAKDVLEILKERMQDAKEAAKGFKELPPELRKVIIEFSTLALIVLPALGFALSGITKVAAFFLEGGLFHKGISALARVFGMAEGAAGAFATTVTGMGALVGILASVQMAIERVSGAWIKGELEKEIKRLGDLQRQQRAPGEPEEEPGGLGTPLAEEQMRRQFQEWVRNRTLYMMQPPPMATVPGKRYPGLLGEGAGDAEDAKRRAKEIADAIEQSKRILAQAEEREAIGFRRNTLDYLENVRRLVESIKLTGAAAAEVTQNLQAAKAAKDMIEFRRLGEEQDKRRKKAQEEEVERLHDIWELEQKVAEAQRDYREEFFVRGVEIDVDAQTRRLERQTSLLQAQKSIDLARLEQQTSVGDLTVAQKIAVEEQKLKIEEEYLQKSLELEIRKAEAESRLRITRIESDFRRGKIGFEQMEREVATEAKILEDTLGGMRETNEKEIQRARIETVTQSNEIIYQDYRQTFERIRSSASSLLDQLFSRTRSWGDVLKSILQAAILTPLKEIAATWIAITLTGGQGAPAPRGTSGRGGFFGQLMNIPAMFGYGGGPGGYGGGGGYYGGGSGGGGGLAPYIFSFAGGRSGGTGGYRGLLPGLARLITRGGGTSAMQSLGAIFPALAMGGGLPTSAAALPLGAGRLGGLVLQDAAMRAGVTLPAAGTPAFGAGAALAPLAGLAGVLGGVSLGAAGIKRGGALGTLMGMGGFASAGASLSLLSKVAPQIAKFGGWTGAGIGAGAGLMISGWQRGGGLGALMAMGGGALAGATLGFKVGGPIGALIGAGVGAAVGGIGSLIGSMRKTAEEKMIEEVRRVYGITISKSMAQQFVQIAKDKYGGDLRMAVSSPEIRELVKLYSLSTGQQASNMPRPMYNVEMAQTRGGLNLMPQYESGNVVASPYVGPTPTTWNPNVYVQLDPNQANQLLEGRVVKVIGDNPGAVSEANTQATQSGTNRTASRAASMEPLTTMA